MSNHIKHHLSPQIIPASNGGGMVGMSMSGEGISGIALAASTANNHFANKTKIMGQQAQKLMFEPSQMILSDINILTTQQAAYMNKQKRQKS
jgi:hypothetical protein